MNLKACVSCKFVLCYKVFYFYLYSLKMSCALLSKYASLEACKFCSLTGAHQLAFRQECHNFNWPPWPSYHSCIFWRKETTLHLILNIIFPIKNHGMQFHVLVKPLCFYGKNQFTLVLYNNNVMPYKLRLVI